MVTQFTKHPPIVIHDHQREEFKEALSRALNTWENRPQWLVDMADQLNGTPEPAGRPGVELKLSPPEPYPQLFQVDSIPGYTNGIPSTEYRITHIKTDSRVATCYDRANAFMVCESLNTTAAKYP